MRPSFPADNRPQQHFSHQMSAGNVYLSVHLRAVESVGRPNPKYWVCIAPGGQGSNLPITPFSGRFVAKRKGRFSSVVRILRPTIAVDRPLVPGHVALPVLLFPLSLASIRRVVAWSILVVLALRRITPLASLHIGLPVSHPIIESAPVALVVGVLRLTVATLAVWSLSIPSACLAVDRPLVSGHVALPVLLFPLSLVSIL